MRLALVHAVVAGWDAGSGLSERVAAACGAKADCGRAQRKRTTGPQFMEKLLVTKSARMGIQGGVYPTASAAALGTPATRPGWGKGETGFEAIFRSVRCASMMTP
jgi:hypothetical protein